MFKGGTEKLESSTSGRWHDPKDEIHACIICTLPDCYDKNEQCNINKLNLLKSERMNLPYEITKEELLSLTQYSLKTPLEIKLHQCLSGTADELYTSLVKIELIEELQEETKDSLDEANGRNNMLCEDIGSLHGLIHSLKEHIGSLRTDIALLS